MFDNNVFISGTCHNVEENGTVIGYEMKTHITYYRGIPLSMVNTIGVKVDGVDEDKKDIRCSLDGEEWFTLEEMTTVADLKWEYGEPLTVRVLKDGGLPAGEHVVGLNVVTRTAYIPVPLDGYREEKVTV